MEAGVKAFEDQNAALTAKLNTEISNRQTDIKGEQDAREALRKKLLTDDDMLESTLKVDGHTFILRLRADVDKLLNP